MIKTVKYEPHPLAKMFPRPTPDEQRDLTEDIRNHGLQEPIVLFEGKVLDGMSRQTGCAVADREPRFVEFMELRPEVRDAGPLSFVIGRNLKRRHLTTSQRAMIAAELIPAMEQMLRKQRVAGINVVEMGENGEEAPRRRGRPPKAENLVKAAATALGVGERSVKRARKLKREKPEKAAEVKAGKITLNKVDAKSSAATRKAKDRADAIDRVRQCCGDEFAKAVENGDRLSRHADLLEFAAQNKPEMVAQQGLLLVGWSLRKAQMFKAKNLTRRHTIEDLVNKAAANGMSLSVAIDGWRIKVDREKGGK